MLDAVAGYLRAVMLHVPFEDNLRRSPKWTTRYDVERWRAEGYSMPLSAYRLKKTRDFPTTVLEDTRAKITTRLSTFGEHPAGLGKFTRTMFATDLRRLIDDRPN
jgi:hypothetical protein